MFHFARAALCVATVASGLAAQTRLKWQIPDQGAAIFDREHRRSQAWVEASDDPLPPLQLGGLPEVHDGGVVFERELDDARVRLAEPPSDPVALLAWLALDLDTFERRSNLRLTLPPMRPFGVLELTGEASAPDDAHRQELRLAIRKVRQDGRRRPEIPEELQQHHRHGFEAELVVQRVFDPGRQAIGSFTARLTGTVTLPDTAPAKRIAFEFEDRWTLRVIAPNRGPGFEVAVAEAIHRGRERVMRAMRERVADLTPLPAGEGGVDHPGGELALMLLTALKAGVAKDDATIERGIELLRAREFPDTYSLGVALMALETLYADPNERNAILEGLLDGPQPRTPSAADRAVMEKWVAKLLRHRDSDVDPAYLSRWIYNGGPGFDNSNTQYALLGLYSAHLCGIDVSPTVWWSAAEHFLTCQCATEGLLPLSLTTHSQFAKASANGTPARRTATRMDVRGWSYLGADDAPYASMTTAGISGLTICGAVLADGATNARKLGEVRTAVRGGLAWLGQHYSVRGNSGRDSPHENLFYYLYGLERACELNQIALIQDRDWYFEGATLLIEKQLEDGTFRGAGLADDCFAVLFLKKASVPVFTGGR